MYQGYQGQEIVDPKEGAARREDHERIGNRYRRPRRGQGTSTAFPILEEHPVPSPVLPVREKSEPLTVQRMERVRDLETSRLAGGTVRSRRRHPMPWPNPSSGHLSVSCWTGVRSALPWKRAWRCSATSKGGTILVGVTLHSVTCRRRSSRPSTGRGRGESSGVRLASRPVPQDSWPGWLLLRCKQRSFLTPGGKREREQT